MKPWNIALLVGILLLSQPKIEKQTDSIPYSHPTTNTYGFASSSSINSIQPVNHEKVTYSNMHSVKDTNYLVTMYEDTLRGISTLISDKQYDSIMKRIIAKWDTSKNSIKINQEFHWGELVTSDTVKVLGKDTLDN